MKNQFNEYLIRKGYKELTPSGKPSTVYDYLKSIDYVCNIEGYSWKDLAQNIHRIITLYDGNCPKADIGNRGHRTVINALKRYREFIISLE